MTHEEIRNFIAVFAKRGDMKLVRQLLEADALLTLTEILAKESK